MKWPSPATTLDQYYDYSDARRGYFYGQPGWTPALTLRPQQLDTLRVRVFRTFGWNHGNDYTDYRSPAFFEQLSRGPVMLLRRESLMERPVAATDPMLQPYAYPVASLPRGPIGYYVSVREQFFLGTPGGEVLPLRNPRRDLLAYFRAEADQLERLAKDNHLSFGEAQDLVYLVNFANQLRAARQ